MATKLTKTPALTPDPVRARVLKARVDDYEVDDKFKPWNGHDALDVHTTHELYEAVKKGLCEVEAKVIHKTPQGYEYKTLDKTGFLEAFKRNAKKKSMREALDLFGMDLDGGSVTTTVGHDYVPLLGGPFTKQLYYYDYLRMHALSFFAFHHDPVARAIVNTTRDFCVGRGFRVDCDNPEALALWRAFDEVNGFQAMIDQGCLESSIYGENMLWWLPNNETKIAYRVRPGQEPPRGLIPRVRWMDPSVIWEIVTYPEDITRVLFYQWVAPTQYQMYSGMDKSEPVPGIKFISQQVPADQVDHYKLNAVSNEKRGRSDLYPILSYLKRLRDIVNYKLIYEQKQSAWAIDTTIDGNQADVDRYVTEMEALGTIPNAGSEFAHSTKIKREYLNNAGGKGGNVESFQTVMNMIAAGVQIPYSYFGFSDASGQTRASALVATEPVAKKFQKRQDYLRCIVEKTAKRLFDKFGMKAEVEVTFPELIVQDRSMKLKDLALAEAQGWISKETAAQIAAQELGIKDFEFEQETQDITMTAPLTTPPQEDVDTKSAITQDQRRDIANA